MPEFHQHHDKLVNVIKNVHLKLICARAALTLNIFCAMLHQLQTEE